MTNQIIIDIFSKTFAFICIIETVAGIILNPLVLLIILKSKQLRMTSTFKILAVSAVNDILVGIPWNQETFFSTMYNFHASYWNLLYCRWIASFVQQTTICIESWIVLTISVDRLFCMYIKKWKKFYFSGYRPYIFTILLCLLIAGLNFHLVFTSGHSVYNNGTEKVICFVSDPYYGYNWYDFAAKFTLYFGFIVPVGILIIVNILIIYKATQFSRVQREIGSTNIANNKRKAQMTKMIVFITFLYVFLSMPQKVFSGYKFSLNIIDFSYGQTLINLVTALLTSYPAFYIFILYFSNKQFAREVKQIILSIKSSRASSSNK